MDRLHWMDGSFEIESIVYEQLCLIHLVPFRSVQLAMPSAKVNEYRLDIRFPLIRSSEIKLSYLLILAIASTASTHSTQGPFRKC